MSKLISTKRRGKQLWEGRRMTGEYLAWFAKVRALLWNTVWVRLRPERCSQGIHADAPDAGCPAVWLTGSMRKSKLKRVGAHEMEMHFQSQKPGFHFAVPSCWPPSRLNLRVAGYFPFQISGNGWFSSQPSFILIKHLLGSLGTPVILLHFR